MLWAILGAGQRMEGRGAEKVNVREMEWRRGKVLRGKGSVSLVGQKISIGHCPGEGEGGRQCGIGNREKALQMEENGK